MSSGRLALVVALLALVVASAGAGWAAAKLPRNSVTTQQVKNGSLLLKDIKKGQVLGTKQKARSARRADLATRAKVANRALSADSADSAATADALQGLAANDLTRAGFTTFPVNTSGDQVIDLVTAEAPVDGFLTVEARLTCASFGGTEETLYYVDVVLDGNESGDYAGAVLGFPHASLTGTPYDTVSIPARFPVAAGSYDFDLEALLFEGDGSLDCNVSATTAFSPYDENGDGPDLTPRAARGAPSGGLYR
ncbi:MAG: hypothetical protein CMH83_23065 [Nocardioides sp.]|nr:hypothetical protein [Nocardioides sp.]